MKLNWHPSVIAMLLAVLQSLFVRESSMAVLASMAVGLFALAVAAAGFFRSRRPRWRVAASRLIPAALYISILMSHLPLRAVFRIYRPAFDRAAAMIEKGSPPDTPFWIGPFRIRMAGRRGDSGTPYLATNTDRQEIDGFVRHPKGHGFNIWSCVALDDGWSCIAED